MSLLALGTLLLLAFLVTATPTAHAQTGDEAILTTLDPAQVEQTIRRVAEWQMAHTVHYPPGHWTMAPLYDGLIDTALATGDAHYLAPVIRAGVRAGYGVGDTLDDADGMAVGHAWLRIYGLDPTYHSAIADDLDAHFTSILAGRPSGTGWSWADALYMAPPTLVHLSGAVDSERYTALALSEFRATHAALYDPAARLFYRDARFIEQRTANDEKIFWSRGNGWVYAGLAEILDELLPLEASETNGRDFYLALFLEMSDALLASQQSDGLWRPSLHDPEHVPISETSGSAFFIFGMTWGVRNGVLDEATYLPAIERGWNGLMLHVRASGQVDHVQPIGEEPRPFDPNSSEPYGAGGVLGAGAEILRLLDAATATDQAALLAEADALAKDSPYLSVLLHHLPIIAKP